MQISYNWLHNYLPQRLPVNELSDILTSIGLEVEGVEKFESIPGSLEGLVVGKILACVPHPNADKLKLTTVDVGSGENLSIVCGASNVAKDQNVVVALNGTTLYPVNGESFKIKSSKIRGEKSEGMICAEDEIGMGNSHEGIIVLPDHLTPGSPVRDYFKVPEPDYTIHIGLTPNRSDANSHLGVARDVCAYQTHHTGEAWKVIYPEEYALESAIPNPTAMEVEILEKELCNRFAGIVLKNVQITHSADWLQQRLKSIGLRPVNNIVDITNFVLHEFGQPLHAYDYDKISGKKISIGLLPEGTRFKTLDEKEVSLRSEDLIIYDDVQPLCMAGVFGGHASAVTENTTGIFLESAYFDPKTIRRSSIHHGFRTDAATHFEKGVDINNVIPALNRAVKLIIEMAGGEVASQVIDKYENELLTPSIKLEYQYLNDLCGKEFKPFSVRNILNALGFKIQEETETYIIVQPPTDKNDVKIAADVVEEILRIDGLDNIPIPSRLNISLNKRPAPVERKWKEKISQYLSSVGLNEIITNSIVNSKLYPDQEQLIKMINSLSSELDAMRPEMLESGLEVISYNVNRKQQDLRLYEIGNVYEQSSLGAYKQKSLLSIWLSGNLNDQNWHQKRIKNDIYILKGIIENVFQICGLSNVQEYQEGDIIKWGRGKEQLAQAYCVLKEKLSLFDIKQEVYYAEVDLSIVANAAQRVKIKYEELPKYPAMRRDLALILEKSVTYQDVKALTNSLKLPYLKNYELFDIFESEKLGKNKRSLALSYIFQDNGRTLTDKDVDEVMQRLIDIYGTKLNATIRSNN